MATATEVLRPRTNSDRIFYPVMCVFMLATVWTGFYKSYFSAGMVTARLPTSLIHVHAVVFTPWMILLAVQIGLVSARKVRLHMRLGLWGFGLATLMIVPGNEHGDPVDAARNRSHRLSAGLADLLRDSLFGRRDLHALHRAQLRLCDARLRRTSGRS